MTEFGSGFRATRSYSEAPTMKIPVFLPVTREFGFRDEFAQDCLLQRRVRETSVPQRRTPRARQITVRLRSGRLPNATRPRWLSDKLRVNPRKSWYRNLERVTTNGDYEVTFHLKRPQSAFLTALASGFSPIYPCHVPTRDMRQHPIGTGPFKFVAFKPNEYIKVARNPDYWKKGRPYLDGIEYTIIKNLSTAVLALVSGTFDMAFPYSLTVPLLKDVKSQMPQAMCEMGPVGLNRGLIVNRDKPPFDNPELRQAMGLSLDRRAFIDILTEGEGDVGGVMQPPPAGLWGMPPDMLQTLPGYGPNIQL